MSSKLSLIVRVKSEDGSNYGFKATRFTVQLKCGHAVGVMVPPKHRPRKYDQLTGRPKRMRCPYCSIHAAEPTTAQEGR